MAEERLQLDKISSTTLPAEARGRGRYPSGAGGEAGADAYEELRPGARESAIDLRELWRMVRRRKWLVITIVTVVTSLVAVQMYRTKSYYQAATIIEIGRDSTTVVGNNGMTMQGDDYDPFYTVNIKTKLLMLTSRSLIEDVVVQLKLDQNPKFRDAGNAQWFGPEAKAEPELIGTDLAHEGQDAPLRSAAESARLAPFVDLISSNLKVQQVRDTRAVNLNFTHADPELAATIANKLAEVFTTRNYDRKTRRYKDTEAWLDSSTRKLKSEVQQAEEALAKYTREHNIFASPDGGASGTTNATLVTDKLTQLHNKVTQTETERIRVEALYEDLKNGRVSQIPEAFAELIFKNSPKVLELQRALGELQTRESQLSVRFGPENPQVQEVRKQMAAIREQLEASSRTLGEKLENDYARTLREERALKATLEQAKAEAIRENQAAIVLNILKSDLNTKRELYNQFLNKTQQARLQLAEQASTIRVIEPAQVPTAPAGPRRLLSVLLAFVLSAVAGLGLAFFLEYLDNTVKTAEDVTRYTQLPALGVIPTIGSGNSLRRLPAKGAAQAALGDGETQEAPLSSQLMTLDNHSSVAEAYRALRTSLLLSSAGHPPKTILITSGRPGEGKTTTAVNTAISLAQLGASVLLIDCDLRRPKVHKVFGVNHLHGLSTYLSREADIEALVQPLPIPNLSLLPCGPIPPNPAELISSEKMRDMLDLLADRYDHIVIDSPPLINVTDPVILSTMVDGVIMVVQAGKSTRDVVRRASQELTGVGAKVFGVVLNNVNLQREGYDEYYYQRYYSTYSSDAPSERSA
jgi:polysaccharide biosynthesis transport protein